MTLLARRERDQLERRERALLGMRDAVVGEMPHLPTMGSAPIDEAVDRALDELRAQGRHLAGDPGELRRLWVLYARRRLIDHGRSAESRRRDRVPVEEHTEALAVSGIHDLGELTEDDRDWWRALEILSVLPGDLAVWGKAWFREIAAGRSGRGLADILGWTTAKTEKTSQRARAQMIAFLRRRATGSVCSARQALLDEFNATRANRSAGRDWSDGAGLDQRRFELVLAHLMSCDDCSTAWEAGHRRAPLARYGAIPVFPFGHAVAAAAALRAKLAGLFAAAHGAVFSVRQRLGVGGGAVITGGGAATLGGKTAAICGAVLCTAGAAGGALVDAVPSILPTSAHHARHVTPPASHPARAKAAAYVAPPTTTTAAATTIAPTTSATTAASPQKPAPSPDPSFTPGDLPSASSTTSAGTPPAGGSSGAGGPSRSSATVGSSGGSTAPASGQPSCTPGDLGC